MVERNDIFNKDNVRTPDNLATIPGDPLAEGEKEKIIQQPKNNAENANNQAVSDTQPDSEAVETHKTVQTSNSIPFPSTDDKTSAVEAELVDENQDQPYGRGQRPRKPQGVYRAMNNGLVAAIVVDSLQDVESVDKNLEDNNEIDNLPPDFTLVGGLSSEPGSLDEALHGPDAKEWQTTLI